MRSDSCLYLVSGVGWTCSAGDSASAFPNRSLLQMICPMAACPVSLSYFILRRAGKSLAHAGTDTGLSSPLALIVRCRTGAGWIGTFEKSWTTDANYVTTAVNTDALRAHSPRRNNTLWWTAEKKAHWPWYAITNPPTDTHTHTQFMQMSLSTYVCSSIIKPKH